MRRLLHAPMMTALLVLAGCQSEDEARLMEKIIRQSLRLDSLAEAMEKARDRDSTVKDETSALLVPGDTAYAFLRTRTGYVAVRIDSLQAYAGGCRVTFNFGNPNTVTLRGVTAQLEWITVGGDGGALETRMPVLYKFMKDLKPGMVTRMGVIAEDVPREKMRAVNVSDLDFESISFNQVPGPGGPGRTF